MSWTTMKKENAVPKVSDGNVKCRKLCFKRASGSDAEIISWYGWFAYEAGRTYGTEMHPAKPPRSGECYTIDEGFHSYSENVALKITERGYEPLLRIDIVYGGSVVGVRWAHPDRIPIILECHIPEGAAYCENEWGEIVSESITVDGIAIMDGKK